MEELETLGENLLFGLNFRIESPADEQGDFEKKCFSLICLKHLKRSTLRPKELTAPLLLGTNESPLERTVSWSLDSSFDDMLITVFLCSSVSSGLFFDVL